MIGRILLFAIAPLLAHAQLVFSIVDGSQETAFTQQSLVYQLRTVEPGMTSSILLRVRNTGSSNADVTQFSAVGAGFTLNRPLPPQTLAPGQILNGTLTFTSGSPANYNAAVRMNAVTLTVLVTVVGAAVLETDPPCSRSSTGTIAFGTVHVGQPVLCNARLHNGTDQPIVITALHVDGPGFSMQAPATPLTLPAGAAIVIALQLDVQGGGSFAGVLSVNARQYVLTATGVDPPVPAPTLDWETAAVASGQQRKLTMGLSQPSPVTTTGYLDVSFQSNVFGVSDDPAVMFLENGARRVRFAVAKGETAATLNGLASVTFQTGTTAGTIRFTFSGIPQGFAADPTVTLAIPPAQIAVDRVVATRLPLALRLDVIGFDNTYGLGAMLFRFFDAGGQLLTPPIPVDFTAVFRDYFGSALSGSAFRASIQFPVTGDSIGIAAMEAEMTNPAGTVQIGRLVF